MKTGIIIPREVQLILGKIEKAGYEAYIVGGCVRDCLLGVTPKDWDIATSAKPSDIKGLFEKTIDTGIKHGTVTVINNNSGYEVTTFRVDGLYTDNRRPREVYFTGSLKEDLARRDFTINAMAYNPQKGLIDYFDGINDLQGKVVRTVGDADKRFNEDALRMLRAVRFSAQLDFKPVDEVLSSISRNRELIRYISMERIGDELTKILVSENPMCFGLLHETGLLQYIIPEFESCYSILQKNPYHIYNVAKHTLKAVSYIDNKPVLRWTMLLHDTGKALTRTTDEKGVDHFYGHPAESEALSRKILKNLRLDNHSINIICRLILHHDRQINDTPQSVGKAVKAIGSDIFSELLKVREADINAQNPLYQTERLEKLARIRQIYDDMMSSGFCTSLKGLAINGHDLAGLGFMVGKEIGSILNKLLDMVIENPELNKKETLIELAVNYREKQP